MSTSLPPRLLLVGLGAVGRSVASEIIRSGGCTLVGAVDPSFSGMRLEHLVPNAPASARIWSSISDAPLADIAFIATTSFAADIEPTVTEALQHGMHVVTIAEELGFSFYDHEAVGRRLDRVACELGLSVLGTGCNPGIIADTLPLLLSSLTRDISRVSIHRTADMSGYGGILSKFGFGLSEDDFLHSVSEGSVIGHVGFRESVAALAYGLGWQLDEIDTQRVSPLFFTPQVRSTPHITLAPDTVAIVRHTVSGIMDGRSVIEAVIDFGIFEAEDPYTPGDMWHIESSYQSLDFHSSSINSHLSTVAVATNVIPRIISAPPGLLTMADLPVLSVTARSYEYSWSS